MSPRPRARQGARSRRRPRRCEISLHAAGRLRRHAGFGPGARDCGLALPEARGTTAVRRRGTRGFPGGRARRGRGGHARDHDEPRRHRALPRGHGRLDPARRRVAARSRCGPWRSCEHGTESHGRLPIGQQRSACCASSRARCTRRRDEPRSRVVGAVLALGRCGLPHRCRPSRRSGRGSEVARGADRSFGPVPLATTRRVRSCGDEAWRAGGARDARRPRREGQALRRPMALHIREPAARRGRVPPRRPRAQERHGPVWAWTTWATKATSTGAESSR